MSEAGEDDRTAEMLGVIADAVREAEGGGYYPTVDFHQAARNVLRDLGLRQIGWARPGNPPQVGGRVWPIDMPPLDDSEQAIYVVDFGRTSDA